MATLERAIEIAAKAHAGTLDKQGMPYILHPLRVMLGVEGIEAQIVGVLHDVVEDTTTTLADLQQEGFSSTLLHALKLVTHDKGTSYVDYVIAAKANPIARQVKLSDLGDNASLGRTLMRPDCLERDTERLQKYVLAYQFLTDQIDAASYRQTESTTSG